jgi:hypothetical protein
MSLQQSSFFGWRVVAGAFVLAACGWGMGFYGPPIFLHAVQEARGWPLAIVSTAVTVHFLVGAATVANLPALYGRFGLPTVTRAGALALAAGVLGWATATSPWQLFVATIFSGAGWVSLGAAPINAIVSPWFARGRAAALAMAYNGASIGGVVFSPLWVMAIGLVGFTSAAAAIGAVVVVTMWVLAGLLFSRTPQQMGLAPDGDGAGAPAASIVSAKAKPLPRAALWRDVTFLTLALGMAFGLFVQVGLIAHLYSLLVPALGADGAGFAMGAATAAAIGGRTLVGWLMPVGIDRRLVASVNAVVQIAGSIAFIAAAGSNIPLLLLGVLLFGAGIGNVTSMPPLIAQTEFVPEDVARVVSLIVAISQAGYAFAPAAFGLIRAFAPSAGEDAGATPLVFVVAAIGQLLAIAAFLSGRRR